MNLKSLKRQGGFTLIELLVVIGVLAILLAVVLIAINPAKHFADSNDTQRRSDVNSILNAVHQYMASHNGTPPGSIDDSPQNIASTGGVDLCAVLVPTYLADLPLDPKTGTVTGSRPCTTATDYDTKYTIESSASDNRIKVSAPDKEGANAISVTR